MISFAIIGRSVQRNLLRSANMVAMIDHDCHHSILCLESFNFLHSSSRQLHSESSKKRQNLLLTKRRFSNHVHYNQIQLEPCPNSFQANDAIIKILDTKDRSKKPDWKELVFGQHCSDHMIEIHWNQNEGWQTPRIVPVHPFCLHPFAKVFHYAPEIFEGMKAYRGLDGRIRIFRPELNMKRMRLSAARVCLPDFDGQQLMELIKKLLIIDGEWVPPYESKASLYIRPTMIATDEALGVSPTTKSILFVVTGPVGPYFSTGFKPVSLLADPKYVRAWQGGSGDRKLGSNYAPTMLVQREAIKQGLQQVLWLYGPDHELTEVGTMNIFMLMKDTNGKRQLITPPLTEGLILPGVTRQSLIELIRSQNEIEVIERVITMAEVKQLLAENRLLEMFGSGTACIVCPIGQILFEKQLLNIPEHEFTLKLFKELLDIQYGIKEYGDWVQIIGSTL
ncbi:branched-chain-amino-acid aminotransferase [Dermatophagoides pteronyssinus]|uniref:Branched-chain-amino-acid aminotransferase n=1 Tax=Dermatophagoides pteronyssinus TaxID=6956 RepID=A0ABQ8JES9_DERPT|nr:branched-chain-amino-acid aminotransferase [Dermatophagoides pteronyssinus]